MNQKGNLAFAFFFIILFILMTFIFVFFAPMAQRFTVESYAIGESLIEDSNDTVQLINDTTTKNQIESILDDQKANYVFQIDLLGSLNMYSAIIIVVISAIVLVLLTRSLVQRQSGVA